MKTRKLFTFALAALALPVLFPTSAALASDVSGTTTSITTSNNSVALALGSGASASIGSIMTRDNSKVSGTLTDNTTSNNSVALGLGSSAFASIGGIAIRGSTVSGQVTSV